MCAKRDNDLPKSLYLTSFQTCDRAISCQALRAAKAILRESSFSAAVSSTLSSTTTIQLMLWPHYRHRQVDSSARLSFTVLIDRRHISKDLSSVTIVRGSTRTPIGQLPALSDGNMVEDDAEQPGLASTRFIMFNDRSDELPFTKQQKFRDLQVRSDMYRQTIRCSVL